MPIPARVSLAFGTTQATSRRAAVVVALLVALVLAGGVALLMVAGSSQAQNGQRLGVQNKRARAAADAAVAMAVRELASNTDHDGDGGVGSISNDGNAGNDPTINQGTRLWATRSEAGGVVTITGFGANADSTAAVQVQGTAGAAGRVRRRSCGSRARAAPPSAAASSTPPHQPGVRRR